MQSVKLVVVGDSGVGKTCMLISYTTNAFPSEYIPTIFEDYNANVMVDGRPIQLNLNDTNGSEEYDRLRPLQYPDTQIFLICFAVNNRRSFQNITDKWAPELIHHRPGVPMILCGLKSDLRDDLSLDATTFVNQDEANSLKTEIGASKYIEVSALTQDNLKQLFDVIPYEYVQMIDYYWMLLVVIIIIMEEEEMKEEDVNVNVQLVIQWKY